MNQQNKEILTGEMFNRLTKFIEDNDLNRMSGNIRKVFFDYLRQQHAGLDIEFGEVLNDIENVIELLEYMEANSRP